MIVRPMGRRLATISSGSVGPHASIPIRSTRSSFQPSPFDGQSIGPPDSGRSEFPLHRDRRRPSRHRFLTSDVPTRSALDFTCGAGYRARTHEKSLPDDPNPRYIPTGIQVNIRSRQPDSADSRRRTVPAI